MKFKKILTELKVFRTSAKRISVVLLAASIAAGNLGYVQVQAAGRTTIQKEAQEAETTLEKLQNLIAEADKLKEEDYTEESWEEFKDVRDSIDDPTQIPEQYLQATINMLQEAIDQLEKVEKETTLEKLQNLIAEADKLKEEDYTEESWEEFKDVRDSIDDPTEIPEQYLQATIDMLQEAIDQLVKVKKETTLEKLQNLIAEADKLKEEDYTEESWEEFKDVRDSIDDPTEIPEQYLQATIDMLQEAIDQLVKVEKETTLEKLQNLIAEADKLKEEDYTEESWAEFKDVRDSIDDPTQIPEKYLQNTIDMLQAAMDQLEKKSEDDSIITDGIYQVPLNTYTDKYKNVETWYGYGRYSAAAIVEVKNGKYYVTLKLPELSDTSTVINVLKTEYSDNINWEKDREWNYAEKMGTKCWEEFDKTKLSQVVIDGIQEKNDKYWYELSKEYSEDGSGTVSFEMDSQSGLVVFKEDATNSYGISIDYLALDWGRAKKTNSFKYENASQVGYQAFSRVSYNTAFLLNEVEWTVEGYEAVAKIPFSDEFKGSCTSINFFDGNDTQLKSDDNYLYLSYSLNTNEPYYGKCIYVECASSNKQWNGKNKVTFLLTNSTKQIVLTDDKTGTQIVTNDNVIPSTTRLLADEIEDDENDNNDAYSIITNNLNPSSYKNMYMYKWMLEYKNGATTNAISEKVSVRFRIPDDWNAQNVQLFGYYEGLGYEPKVAGEVIEEDGSRYFVVTTNRLGYYALYETKTYEDAETMKDGTYSVPLSVYHLTTTGQLSMADRCLGDTATVVVKDGVKTLYMDYTSVENMSLTSYMTRMWIYGADMEMKGNAPTGSLIPVVFTSYYKNDDGSYLTDSFNEGTLNYYPKTGYVQLVSDKAQWPARFKVPIMDAIGGGNFEQDAWLTLDWANAQKMSDDVPEAPIKSGLGELLSIAQTAVQAEYTAESWENLKTAYDEAEKVYVNAASSEEELTNAYAGIRTAIDSLEKEKAPELTQGVYTANGKLDDTGYITDTRFLVAEAGKKADIYLQSEGIQDFAYYDIATQTYKGATLIKNENDEVTGINFSLDEIANSVSVRYQTANGEIVQGLLTFADMTKQEVNKEPLETVIGTAQEKLKDASENPGNYDAKAVAALQSAVSEGTKVFTNPVAIQSEIDQQVEAIRAAIDQLAKNVSLEGLKQAIENAKAQNEADYTASSYQKMKELLSRAEELATNENASVTEIDKMTLELNAAVEGLVERASDWEAFDEMYEKATAITNDANYPGWDALQTVIADAKALKENPDATQDKVDAMTKTLETAIANLQGSVDKSELITMISNTKALDTSAYMQSSVDAFQAAIASAQAVVDNPNASQNDVDKQILALQAAADAMLAKEVEDVVYDGVYTIQGRMWHASADQASMGNAALLQPMQIVVSTDKETGETTTVLRMEYAPLTTSGFEGYLAELNYFPGWEGGDTGYDMPKGETPVPATVESYYEGVYDSYNDPTTGTDSNVKGKLYPHIMNLTLDALGDSEVWVQVYVPVMEALNTGGGRQYAKIQLDWDTRVQISGIDTDKSALKELIEKAQNVEQEDASDESFEALQKMILAATDIYNSMNAGQDAVDRAVKALQAAMDTLTKDEVKTDKSELKKAIDVADSYLNSTDMTFTDSSRALLQQARDEAQKVYDDESATQTQINKCVEAIDQAIQSLERIGADKTNLAKAMNDAKTYLQDTEKYTAASVEALRSAYDTANGIYEDANASQDDVDAQVRILEYLMNHMAEVSETKVDKSGFHDLLVTAANLAGREDLYTKESIDALKKVIQTAEKLYDNENATQEEVTSAANELVSAMMKLEAKPAGPNNGGNNNNGNNNNGNNNGNNNTGNDSNGGLDIKNLADGVYSITGNMVKIDKTTASMSDAAINHTIKLTVKNGKYYITLNFNGLTISQKLGYLSTLKYFTTGYTLDKYGNPQGTLADVTVDSYQKNADGTLVSDTYGTNYPDEVTFELIPEALNDGYAPLQVFVPIMEAISKGTGTQPVFLKLDWSTIKSTTANDPNFSKNDNTNNNTNGNLTNGSSLGKNTLGSSTLGSSTLKSGTSSLGSSSLKSGTSSLSSSSSLKSGSSSLESGSNLQNTSSVKTDDEIQNNTVWAALLLLGGVALLAGIMGYGRKKKANRR